ncbi:MAG: hypothetical protein HYZ37_08525 [Candidatus Solibacter usitatus]|nr:hypothetical protein [Candidatus Solibacter usitatus]
MNETQFYISVAVGPAATMVVVLIGVLLNNNRIGDLNNRISDLRSEMNARLTDMKDSQEANLRRVEDMLLGKFAELDNRLSRIEGQRH